MAIRGSIEEAGLPDVLQLLSLGAKSGCISVTDGAALGEIFLDAGMVTWADVAGRGDRLGDSLVKSGKVSAEQLREAAAEAGTTRSLSDVLVAAGHIAIGEMDRFAQHHVEESVYLMFAWTRGDFSFTSQRKPPTHATRVSLHAERLLLEGARRVDEWNTIREKIPAFDLTYRRATLPAGKAASLELSSAQHRILPLLDGTRDVTGVIELSGMSEFDVGKALYGLITAGMVQLMERRARVRHLDGRELLAYALREAEFSDAERRKDAARHIGDCVGCTNRLREIHVRRTTASKAVTVETPAAKSAAPPAPAAAPPAPAKPAAPLPAPTPAPAPTKPAAPAKAVGPPAAPPAPATPPAAKQPAAPAKAATPPNAPAPPATPPAPDAPKRLSTDIIWLTSPAEADKMVSAERTERRTRDNLLRAAAREAAAIPETPAAPAARPAPPPSVEAARSAPAPAALPPEAPIAAPASTPVAPTPAAVAEQPPVATRQSTSAPPVEAPRAAPAPARRSFVTMPVAVGAALAVAVVGFVGFKLLTGRQAPVVEVAAGTPGSAAPQAESPPASPLPATDSVPERAPAAATPSTATPPPASPARPAVRDSAPAPAAVSPPRLIVRDTAPPLAAAPPRPAVVRDTTSTPAPPDAELASGGWAVGSRAEALELLGGRFAAIQGLGIESIATSSARGRSRVRVAQVTRGGQRIVLIETAGVEAPDDAGGTRPTAISVTALGAAESIGSASLGSLQITARSTLTPEALRPLLVRLRPVTSP